MLKGYRSLIFNGVSGAAALAQIFVPILPERYTPYAVAAVALGNFVLRFFTDTPVGVK